MTEVGKNKLNHPSLGTAGGAGLHSQMEGIFTEISNNLPARWKLYSAVANSTTLTFEHNLQVPLSDLRLHIYTSSAGVQTRLTDLTGWTIGATSGYEQSKVDITVPSSGGPFTFYLYISHEPMSDKLSLSGGTMTGDIVLKGAPTNNLHPATKAYADTIESLKLSLSGGMMTGDIEMSGKKIVNLSTDLSTFPIADHHAATKKYVDSVAQGLDIKPSVRVATTANITLSGTQTIDGVAVVAGDRVLVKDQTTASQNGIYVVSASGWSRATDMDAWTEVPGAFCFVELGTQADKGYVCTADQGGTIGTTAMSWTQFAGVGVITAAANKAVSITNNQIDFAIDGSTLSQTGSGVKVADGGITATQLADSAVDLTTAKVTGALPFSKGGTGTAAGSRDAALNALLPSQATYANKYLKTDGTNTLWASASGGAGELNCVLNSSGADGITGWSAGTSHNTPTVVTGASNPLDPVVSTAFSFSATAAVALGSQTSTSGVYDAITLPVGLENRKLKVDFYYTTPASADGTWALAIYKGATRLALSTDSSGDSVLPAGTTGKFVAYFDTDDTNSYSVNFVQRTRTNANTLYITNVIVGPGIQPQGAVVGEWQSFNMAITGSGGNPARPATYTEQAFCRRVGSSLEIQYSYLQTVASATPGSGTYIFGLPTNFGNITIDYSEITATASNLGGLYAYNGTTEYIGYVTAYTSNTFRLNIFNSISTTTFLSTTNGSFGNATLRIQFNCKIPIAEWAGSGTVSLLSDEAVYETAKFRVTSTSTSTVANNGVMSLWGASASYDTAGGYNGSWGYTVPATGKYRVTAQLNGTGATAVSVFIQKNGTNAASSAAGTSVGFATATIDCVKGDVIRIIRGGGGTLTLSGDPVYNYFEIERVADRTIGEAVGFAYASATESGLVNTTTQTFAGDKTFEGITEFQNAIKARSAATITDNLDVSGINLLFFGAGTTTINGLSGGTLGQMIYVYGSSGSARLILTHNNASGTQKFLNPRNIDLSSAGGYGGLVLYCNGTFWYPMSTAQTHLDYSATLASGSWTGSGGTPHVLGSGATSTLSLTRVGKIVTFRLTVTTGTSPGSTYASATGSNIIPDWAQPLSTVYVMQPYNFATTDFAFLQISSSGSLMMDLRRMYSATGQRVAFGASETLLPMIGSWVID